MAPRKKAKLSHDDEADGHDDNSASKTPKKTRRSRKGCLENVQALPLDISLQIFGHLHPKDLLDLTRTSKAFRSFFLNRANSISIWKSSLRQVEGLPEKPESFSEPAFAQLLFSSFCQNCGKPGAHNPIWRWMVRYCVECTEAILGFELFDPYLPPGRRMGWRIHGPQFDDFSREWKNIARNDEDGRKALIEKQCRATKESQKVWTQFEAWHMIGKLLREAELEGIREQRLQEIMDRLRHEGSEWLPEMEYFPSRPTTNPVDRPRKTLLNAAWPKVLAALQIEMAALRARRLEEKEKQEKLQETNLKLHG
ncbi:hypothetical protein V8D89_011853 [Ganoderma adspersum]